MPEVPPPLELDRATLGSREPPLARELSFRLPPGEVWAVTGPPLSGKSTLVRAALGVIPPAAGEVRLFGQALAPLTEGARLGLRAQVGYAPQGTAFLANVGLQANLALTLRWRGELSEREIGDRLAETCERLGVTFPRPGQLPAHVDERTRRLLTMARALAPAAALTILDGVTSWLEDEDLERVRAALQELRAAGGAALVATGDGAFAGSVADRVLLLDGRGPWALGRPEELSGSTDPAVQAMLKRASRGRTTDLV